MLYRILRLLAFYGGLLLIWWLVAKAEFWPPYLLPSPDDVKQSLQTNLENGRIQDALKLSLQRLAIGYTISFFIGVIIGILTGSFRWLDETLGSLILGIQSLPSITWVPLAILWFGLNDRAMIFIVLMGSIFSIAISARDGVRGIPPLYHRVAHTLGANRLQSLRYVVAPAMLPSMVQGLKLGWSFSWRSLMAGELIFASAGGLGNLLSFGRDLNDMSLVVSIMLVIVAVGLIVDMLIFARLESWVRERWGLAA